jgi:hypothetical protein
MERISYVDIIDTALGPEKKRDCRKYTRNSDTLKRRGDRKHTPASDFNVDPIIKVTDHLPAGISMHLIAVGRINRLTTIG